MYANDRLVIVASENFNDNRIINKLEHTSNWMRIAKTSLNARKCEFMVVGYRTKLNSVGNELTNLVLNNEVIQRLEKKKYL